MSTAAPALGIWFQVPRHPLFDAFAAASRALMFLKVFPVSLGHNSISHVSLLFLVGKELNDS